MAADLATLKLQVHDARGEMDILMNRMEAMYKKQNLRDSPEFLAFNSIHTICIDFAGALEILIDMIENKKLK